MNPSRVLQVVLSLNPGGTERLVVEIVKRLGAQIPMMVCCLDDAGAWAREVEAAGARVIALERGPGFQPGLAGSVAKIARRHGATVIHAHHYSPFVYSAMAKVWRRNARIVFTEHGRLSDARPSGKRRLANTLLARVPSDVFAVSEDLREHLVSEGFARAAVGVIYNGIDVGPPVDAGTRDRIRGALGVDAGAILIGTIARLDPVKDLGTLIRAVAAVSPGRNDRVVLCVIGDGPERGRLERLTADMSAASCVRFLGHRDDAREWLAGCDIYANSSVSEGVSLTILEGMAAGLPVVATRVGGTPEIIDETCARLVPPRDIPALEAALIALIDNAALRRQLGRTARLRVESRFTLERMVGEYRSVYCGQSRTGRDAGGRERS